MGTYAVELEIDLLGRWSETVVGTEFLDDGHIVQFYGHDAELADKVADYLLGALDRDGVAIVIATPEHRDAFEARLTKAGAGLDEARERGSYVALDARATVAEFSAAVARASSAT